MRISLLTKLSCFLLLIIASISCSNEPEKPIDSIQRPAQPFFKFKAENVPFEANNFKAYIKKASHTGHRELLIVGQNPNGDISQIRVKNVLSSTSSFNAEAGSIASLSYTPLGQNKMTTELTTDNNSSLIIEKYDSLTNTITGKFDSVFCSNNAGVVYHISEGTFSLRYEDIIEEDELYLTLNQEEITPAMTFVKSIPEPLNTLQITGFNGGTESYTLILKNDLKQGTYQMHEFDVAPYFFYSDKDLNQFDAVTGTVTIESFDIMQRVLTGSFDANMRNGTNESKSSGEFSIFVM